MSFTSQTDELLSTSSVNTTIENCSSATLSGGSCKYKLGAVCSYYSEWFLDKEWSDDDEDDCQEGEICDTEEAP